MKRMSHILVCTLSIAILSILPGCASVFYSRTHTGEFRGKLDIEWIAPNRFIYRPNPRDPLVYRTFDGRTIQPRLMYTDGGSVPRLLWSVPNLGPWDFAPGYIIHDWLFEQHHCREGDWQAYNFDTSVAILPEAVKTQMEKSGDREPVVVWAIAEAVRTPIAKELWDSGECKKPPSDTAAAPLPGQAQPVKIRTIEFN